jgi:hypothetical protein
VGVDSRSGLGVLAARAPFTEVGSYARTLDPKAPVGLIERGKMTYCHEHGHFNRAEC